MNPPTYTPEANPLNAPCPVCKVRAYQPCTNGQGRTHTAREALRVAEIEAARIPARPLDRMSMFDALGQGRN